MFFVAITKQGVAQNFENSDVKEFKIDSSIITTVTDNFLSKLILESNGFSIYESPFISSSKFKEIVFSKVKHNKNDNTLSIFKPTISGRPIYYYIDPKGDFFCSTHIILLRQAGVPIEENLEALPEFFVYNYIMPPQTMYKDIFKLTVGSKLFIKLVDEKCVIESLDRYIPPEQDKRISSSKVAIKKTFSHLSSSIKALNPCKDKLAVLLSGGLDSSILLRLCQTFFDTDTTYSTGFPFEDKWKNNEREYALSAAEFFGTHHIYHELTTKNYLYGFVEAVNAAEEPLFHLQSVLLYALFKKGIPINRDIVINGQGAGGIWGLCFHNQIFINKEMPFKLLLKHPLFLMLKAISPIIGLGENLTRLNDRIKDHPDMQDPDNVIWSLGNYGSEEWVCEYFGVKKYDIIKNRYKIIKKFEKRSIYEIISILDFYGDISVTQSIWGKLGESQQKILYYPFNDYDLLNYTFLIPWHMKLGELRNICNLNRQLRLEPKSILRGVARQLELADFIIFRPKSGFGVNVKKWVEKDGVFEPLIPLISKVFNEKQIRKMQSTDPKKAMTFWNMLNYAIWKRLFINNEPLEILLEELNETI